MSDSLLCSKCGAVLPAGGICAACAADFLRGEPTCAPGEAFVPPSVAELAEKFPQLEIFELVGRGGMGAVYRARQRELDRIVALKILPPGIGDDPAFAERFAREARALAKLSHPNIVTLFEFGRAKDGPYFFLMEFVDGMNLRQLLHAERISPREALEIVPQICDALQFAHDHGIVHRDIKPENILLDRRGRVKVADFGLAKLIGAGVEATGEGSVASGDLTGTGKILGTPSYMAPEQTAQPDAVDHRADIYALGVVFYQMLTGELPEKQILPPSHKVRIDVRLDEVVLRALEKNPDRRYEQASVMKTQVETIAETPPPPQTNPAAEVPIRAGESLYATAEYLATTWGALKLHEGMGMLSLYADRLVLGRGGQSTEIPYHAVRRLNVMSYPFWLSPMGRISILVEFEEGGKLRRFAFTPTKGMFPFLGNSKPLVTEWFIALREAITAANGQPPAGSETPELYRDFSNEGLMWAKLSMVCSPIVGLAALFLIFSGFSRNPGPALLFLLFFIGGILFVARHRRSEWQRNNPLPQTASESRETEGGTVDTPSRFSRTAIVGACWIPFVLIALLFLFRGLHPVPFHMGHPPSSPGVLGLLIGLPLALIGLTAPFGTTILGWVAVSQIRRSAGKLRGLWLAVFDGLLFPLLVLDGVIAGAVFGALRLSPAGISIFILGPVVLGVIVLADFLIIRLVWRAASCPSIPREAMDAWLALMDNGDYAGSWDAAAPRFQSAMAREEWVSRGEKVRRPLGDLLSRRLVHARYTQRGTRLETEFRAAFGSLPEATETVTFLRPPGGEWQAIGYVIRPSENRARGWKIAFWCILGALLLTTAINATIHLVPARHQKEHSTTSIQLANQPLLRVTVRVLEVPATFDDAQLLRPSGLLDSGEVKVLAAPYVVAPSGGEGTIEIPPNGGIGAGASPILSGETRTLYVKPTLEPGTAHVRYALDGMMWGVGAESHSLERQPMRSDSLQLGELQLIESNRLPNGNRQLVVISAEMEPGRADAAGNISTKPSAETNPTFESFVERVRKELSLASIRFDRLHISAVNNDIFLVSFSGLEAHGGSNGKDAWIPIGGSVGSLEAKRVSPDGKWDFRGLNQLAVVRFTIPDLDLEKLLETNLAEALPTEPVASPNLSFGPVMERVVGDVAAHQAPELIDLETGTLLFQSNVLGDTAQLGMQQTLKLFRERGVDATGTLDPNTRGLAGWDIMALPVSASAWDRLKPVELKDALKDCQPGSPVAMPGTEPLPATYIFKTREGGMGLLQIIGFTENPRGVKIRYKLVQDIAAARTDASPVIPKINFREATLLEALDFIRLHWALNITFDQGITDAEKDARITARWENLTARQALTALLDSLGLQLVENSQSGVARIANKPKDEKSAKVEPVPYGHGNPDISPVISKINFQEATLLEALDFIRVHWALNMTFDQGITDAQKNARITARWENLTALQALRALLDSLGLQLVDNPETGVARIANKAGLSGKAAPKPVSADAQTAYREWQDYFTTKSPREMADPDVAAKMDALQGRFVASLRGTVAEPIWTKLEQIQKDARRAYAKGNDAEWQRLSNDADRLGAELKVMFEQTVTRGFIRKFGTYPLDGNGSGLVLTPSSGGRVSFTLTRAEGAGRENFSIPDFFKKDGWFAYIDSAERVWIFDGVRQLDVVAPDGRYSAGDLGVRALCPEAVWDAVPESVRKFYREPQNSGDSHTVGEPQKVSLGQ